MELPMVVKTKFALVFGKKVGGRLVNTKAAGHALMGNDTDYYSLYLWHTGKTYYLSPNLDSIRNFTIFEKKVGLGNQPHFQNPVGRAWVPGDVGTHMELEFNAMERRIFMSLYPDS